MYRNNFCRLLAEIWPKKITSRDGCGLLNILLSAKRAAYFCGKSIAIEIRGPTTHPKSRNTKKTPRLRELFRKVRANFCPLPCDRSQEPNGNCSEKLVQMHFFILGLGFFRVDFPPLRDGRCVAILSKSTRVRGRFDSPDSAGARPAALRDSRGDSVRFHTQRTNRGYS